MSLIHNNGSTLEKLTPVIVLGLVMGFALLIHPGTATATSDDKVLTVIAKQEPGKLFYWILPGKRRLSRQVFGTPDNPLRTAETRIKSAKGPVKDLLKKFPFLVGVPVNLRETNMEGTQFTKLNVPTLFSNRARITSGQFSVTYKDRQPYDTPGKPTDTLDDVDFTASFTDPAGNEYQIKLKRVFMSPIPGYETGGGVITNAWHHGITGTGSPLMPRVYSFGAFWGFGDVVINGEVSDTNKVIHMMTTQIVRDRNYQLALDEELPLAKENTIAGQTHHTHLVVLPIKVTPGGPTFEPVKTAFTLPNGKKQPFIHTMWEADTIVQAPVRGVETKQAMEKKEEAKKEVSVTVEGEEWSFNPETIRVKKGKEVTIEFKNVGNYSHNLRVGQFEAKTDTIGSGQTASITFKADKTGKFPFWCDVPGHRSAGLEGTLIVEE